MKILMRTRKDLCEKSQSTLYQKPVVGFLRGLRFARPTGNVDRVGSILHQAVVVCV